MGLLNWTGACITLLLFNLFPGNGGCEGEVAEYKFAQAAKSNSLFPFVLQTLYLPIHFMAAVAFYWKLQQTDENFAVQFSLMFVSVALHKIYIWLYCHGQINSPDKKRSKIVHIFAGIFIFLTFVVSALAAIFLGIYGTFDIMGIWLPYPIFMFLEMCSFLTEPQSGYDKM